MAAFMARAASRVACQNFRLLAAPRTHIKRNTPISCFISTSKKNKDAAVIDKNVTEEIQEDLEAKDETQVKIRVYCHYADLSNRLRSAEDIESFALKISEISEEVQSADDFTVPQIKTSASTENWMSYGYSIVDRDMDEFSHHAVLFVTVTLCLVGGAYFLAYAPDFKRKSWLQREAYLELARRERDGLPLIDKNLISPDKIDLPSDEELGDYNIII